MIKNISEIKKRIELHFHDNLHNEEYKIKNIPAIRLLTWNRFDLAFKLLYLEMLDCDLVFSRKIYAEHIRALSLGKFTEPGNDSKNSIGKFIDEFDAIFKSIKNSGFDAGKTVIPLSHNNTIANGAHRVASVIFLNKSIDCVQINTNNHRYDYRFFYDRNMSNEVLDIGATKFIEYADNVFIAFIWPTAQKHDQEIESVIPNIVYRKEIKLNPNGAHNLLSQIYYGEEWVGNVENDFKGVKAKLLECFKTFEPIRVVAFQAEDLNEVVKIKDKVRDIFNVGKHSIHITDTKEEAIRVARLVFNDNSIHFLNHAKPNKYLSTYEKINQFKKFLKNNSLDASNVLLDSSFILSLYGLREANDIDFFVEGEVQYNDNEINTHDEELKHHRESKIEMIRNPKFYFYFDDLKFISFSQLYTMKKNRAEEKDINDCNMMKALIEGNKLKENLIRFKQKLYYKKIQIRNIRNICSSGIMTSLKFVGLFNVVRKFYRLIVKK
ncbi:hypothetical protein [Bathymodiolus septemdierum thioautotrophic gill symbiont]|uniref:Uncharacterized protein n=1 Tax=endosymbiont of Bathymodiolus septemdierum str. Myojin knoll TaxID=1303921 RepID=A0A0P0US83_9GAMM|nr:hypothetical protein [Bathymodiolus septemdierum thioautotrophic gill symbiont]BAS67692.1 conserved hypothetical protein [endosymbiont of Bathymodiolus septemdierum str. Myojin knoll]